jgi:hypothetical protein
MDHKSPPSGTMPRAHGFLPAFRSLASYRFRPKQCPSSCYDMMLPPRTTIDEQIALSFCRPDDVVFSTKKEPWRRGAQNSRTTRARRLSASERAEQTCCSATLQSERSPEVRPRSRLSHARELPHCTCFNREQQEEASSGPKLLRISQSLLKSTQIRDCTRCTSAERFMVVVEKAGDSASLSPGEESFMVCRQGG